MGVFSIMKIQSIETFCTRDVGLVRLRTDDGAQGWGQVSSYHSDISAMVLHRQVAVHALGRDISDLGQLGDLLDSIYEREYKFPGSYMCRALGGLDTAIWDRSEEHTSELQSLMRISYAVFCLKKKKDKKA